MSADTALLVLITCPPDAAEPLATALVDARVAACVNLVPGLSSIYRWQGKVERAQECLLMAKTTRGTYAALEAAVLAHHPYELPEILAVEAAAGLPAYLQWLHRALTE